MKIHVARSGMNGHPDLLAASADEGKAAHAAIGAVAGELTEYGSAEAQQVLTLWSAGQSEAAYALYRRSNLDLHVTPVLVETVPYLD